MVVIVEQDALGLQQLSPKLISTRIIAKYGKLHYSMLIRVVESCTMALIQQFSLPFIMDSFLELFCPLLIVSSTCTNNTLDVHYISWVLMTRNTKLSTPTIK